MNVDANLKYYPLESMAHTPFWSGSHSSYETLGEQYLTKAGITRADNSRDCDFYVRQRYPVSWKSEAKHLLKYGSSKPILVWTHEPRFCVLSSSHISASKFRPKVLIMNVYTKNVFLNNVSLYGWAIGGERINHIDISTAIEARSKHKQICVLTGYVNNPDDSRLIMDGEDIDLIQYRQNLSLQGYKMGQVDIYGRYWPNNIAKEVSRGHGFANWHGRKIEILQDYAINICIENTNFNYYCTEKIWDSIRGGCLPIYYGSGNRIYEDFPEESFIDASLFDSHREVIEYAINMTNEEYCQRMNRCIDVYNHFLEQDNWKNQFDLVMESLVENLRMRLLGKHDTVKIG